MPATLRPNGIDYTSGGEADDPLAVIGIIEQPPATADQEQTVLYYAVAPTFPEVGGDRTITFQFWRADASDPANVILGTQIGPDLIVTPVTDDDDPNADHSMLLIAVDRAPGQAGTYAVTALSTVAPVPFQASPSTGLLTVGA